mgnify:CR=1 FL=1
MKALVTGGAGFIGSNLVDRLLKDGHEVRVVDNESTDAHEQFYWNDSAENFKWDISDSRDWIADNLTKDIDVVFHLAAEARIQPAMKNPKLTTKTNVLGTCNILQAARENGVKRVVYSSTSAAYGLTNEPPVTEDMSRDCLNAYSITKCAGEDLCKMFYDIHGLETIIFRYFNVYGERQPTRGQYAPVVGLFQRQLTEGVPMTIVGDGTQMRDFTYVGDVVEANIKAALTENKEAFGEIINIGTGVNYNMFDLVRMIGGEDADWKHIPPRTGEVKISKANIEKAKNILDWTPQVSLEGWLNAQKV